MPSNSLSLDAAKPHLHNFYAIALQPVQNMVCNNIATLGRELEPVFVSIL